MINTLLILSFLLAVYYAYFLFGIKKGLTNLAGEQEHTGEENPTLSVIIPLRNESNNVKKLCKSLAEQDYSGTWEVVFVDDNSTDDTVAILTEFLPENGVILKTNSKVNERARKKIALKMGIENSTGEIIIVSDADCIHTKHWLSSMLEYFDKSTGIVAGPVDLITDESIFGKFQRLEYASLILVGAGLIGINKPTICSAANLAYRRKIFDEVGGFDDQLEFTSGDDDLFIQKVAKLTDYKIRFAFSKDTIVRTAGKEKVDDFLNQRKRWASKSLFYDNNMLVLKIILIALFYVGLIVQPILAFTWTPAFFHGFLISLAIKFIFEFDVVKFGIEKIYDKKMLKIFLLAELLQVPYIVYSGIAGIFGGFVWKGNKVKR